MCSRADALSEQRSAFANFVGVLAVGVEIHGVYSCALKNQPAVVFVSGGTYPRPPLGNKLDILNNHPTDFDRADVFPPLGVFLR